MASETDTEVQCVGKNIPRTKRKLQKHLRSAGLAYVSRTGKIIPAKQVAEELCQCPHKCNDRVSRSHRENLFTYFYHTLGDADAQNQFLRAHMDVRARLQAPEMVPEVVPRLPGTRPPRRITCKYLIPLMEDAVTAPASSTTGNRSRTLEICQKAFCSAFVISTKRVRLQREKLIHSMGLNSYHHQKHLKKKLMLEDEHFNGNNRVRVRRDSSHACTGEMEINRVENVEEEADEPMGMACVSQGNRRKCLVDDPLIPLGISVPEGVTIAPVTATPDHDRDIAIVNNFFSNQLWKPEYIGTNS